MKLPVVAICPAINQVLETMCFCECVYRGESQLEEPLLGARLRFHGEFSGDFRIMVVEPVAIQLATELLGTDPGKITAVETRAAIQELANVACGGAMGAWMPHSVFQFSLPEILGPVDSINRVDHGFSVFGATAELAIDVRFSDVRVSESR